MPIIDVVMRQLQAAGIQRVTLAVGHLAELLMAYISHRAYEGMKIDFSREKAPLGTAGPLSLLEDLDERFLVMNGDLLTTLDFDDLARQHAASGALATIASCVRSHQVDLGILEVNGAGQLVGYNEKPTYNFRISMGIYVFEPDILRLLKRGESCDLPQLIRRALQARESLNVYSFEGYWLDIGRTEDYAKAIEEFDRMRPHLLRGRAAD